MAAEIPKKALAPFQEPMRVLYSVLFAVEKHTEGAARFRKELTKKEGGSQEKQQEEQWGGCCTNPETSE